jgi:hypothetical protein
MPIGGAKNIQWYTTCIEKLVPLFHPPCPYDQYQGNLLIVLLVPPPGCLEVLLALGDAFVVPPNLDDALD